MTANFEACRAELAELRAEAEHRQLTGEERQRLRLLATLLGDSVPDEATLDDLARAARAPEQDRVETEPPPKRLVTDGEARTLSGTLADVFTARLQAVLDELHDLGYGPRGAPAGSVGARGQALVHEASELLTIFHGLAAMRRHGLAGAALAADDREQLYTRVTSLERAVGAFLSRKEAP